MKEKQQQDKYNIVAFPKARQPVVDSLRQAKRMNVVHLITEIDVTDARRWLRELGRKIGESISFTAFLTSCLARAVDEDKSMHAYRTGNKLIVYDEVDISVLIEREVAGGKAPVFPHVVKGANRKTLREIHDEIRAAQREEVDSSGKGKWIGRYWLLPAFIRGLIWRRLLGSPHWRKKVTGTVAISAIGMFGKGSGWGIPIPAYTLSITVGGIAEKPSMVEGQIEIREYLGITVSFDHDIIDGAPAARFAQRLKELTESGYGLSEMRETKNFDSINSDR
jgi:pyruvate/2-oxoglutarate dehydrogenase complex dihydrolipoamide acyltransferase (E2) component